MCFYGIASIMNAQRSTCAVRLGPAYFAALLGPYSGGLPGVGSFAVRSSDRLPIPYLAAPVMKPSTGTVTRRPAGHGIPGVMLRFVFTFERTHPSHYDGP
jgi:hypothetical protein